MYGMVVLEHYWIVSMVHQIFFNGFAAILP